MLRRTYLDMRMGDHAYSCIGPKGCFLPLLLVLSPDGPDLLMIIHPMCDLPTTNSQSTEGGRRQRVGAAAIWRMTYHEWAGQGGATGLPFASTHAHAIRVPLAKGPLVEKGYLQVGGSAHCL